MPTTAKHVVIVATGLLIAMSPWRQPPVLAENYGKLELVRDQWGIPHVFAETDRGAMYGLGYASAEDRSFQMHYTLRMMQGRLAETIGDVKQMRRDSTATDLDRKVRTFGFYRAAQALAQELDEETRQLLAAYSAGVNAYLKNNADDWPRRQALEVSSRISFRDMTIAPQVQPRLGGRRQGNRHRRRSPGEQATDARYQPFFARSRP